ncbi:hypothetical protein F5Y06DRAFT_304556 [Hypoxylon sp. FL0890]|nr:hypothetical protein F5Y06DRAFT_304556 [Hypoxylon sp. FL0890]
MKLVPALLGLVGVASAANTSTIPKSFADLGNGMYTIPYINETIDFAHAILDNYTLPLPNSTTNPPILPEREKPGKCVREFPSRTKVCRPRKINRISYLRALALFLDWIETGPEAGWLPGHKCKALVYDQAVVSACSFGGPNPTCATELQEAMRQLDLYCDFSAGADLYIYRWKKGYGRYNSLDGE